MEEEGRKGFQSLMKTSQSFFLSSTGEGTIQNCLIFSPIGKYGGNLHAKIFEPFMMAWTLQLGAMVLFLPFLLPTTLQPPRILMGLWEGGMVPMGGKMKMDEQAG